MSGYSPSFVIKRSLLTPQTHRSAYMSDKRSKIYFLTGSSRGLGRGLAEAILEAGHKLIATARRPKQLEDLVQQYGESVFPLALDVTDYKQAQSAMQEGTDHFGGLDVVINNAGSAVVGSVEDLAPEMFQEQVSLNFMGAVHVTKAAIPIFRKQGRGHLILVSSIGDRIATPGAAAYYASKRAVAGFAASLAQEVGPLGIKVSAVEPGGMKTDFAEDSSLKVVPGDAVYANTVGATVSMMKAPNYTDHFNDPAKVANVILKVAGLEEPPLRLLIGSATMQYALMFDQGRAAADEKWKELSALAD
jgi:NAD(P)-dependent dehydrogenase (short-subunit alcohol dehydrogenase family)